MAHLENAHPGDIVFTSSRFRVERVYTDLPGGGRQARDIVRHGGSVVILPVVDDARVCLIRNYRVSVGRRLWELPAGTLEPGEAPLACAQRELLEETGYVAADWRPLLEFYAAPGVFDERMFVFAARRLEQRAPAREPGEEIENAIVTWDEALTMIRRGEIEDAKTICGLLRYRFLPEEHSAG